MADKLNALMLLAWALFLTGCASKAPLPEQMPFDALEALKTAEVRMLESGTHGPAYMNDPPAKSHET